MDIFFVREFPQLILIFIVLILVLVLWRLLIFYEIRCITSIWDGATI
jgi:hypothetical protein